MNVGLGVCVDVGSGVGVEVVVGSAVAVSVGDGVPVGVSVGRVLVGEKEAVGVNVRTSNGAPGG